MADGSIRVNTKLDTKPAQADLKKLEQECEKTAEKIEQAGQKIKTVFTGASKGQLNSAFKTANKELEKTEAALEDIESKIAAIQAETDKMLPEAATDEQAANLLAIEEMETEPLLKKRDELTAKAAEYKQQMEAITAEINKQAQAEAAQAALKTGAKDAVADAEWLGKIQTEQEYQAVLEQTKAKMAVIEQEAARIAQLTGVPISNLLQQNSQYQTLARRAELLANNQDKFKGKVSGTEKEIRKLGNTMTKAFDKGLKKVSRMAVGLLGARSAFMALRRAANTYLEANEDLKNQVDGLWNVLAVAIGPVVEQLVNWLTIAISYVNAFVKALWGVDLVAKANALALKKQEKATTAAAKAAEKSQLAGFDEMNKLSDTSSDSSGGSGASAGAGQFKLAEVDTGFIDGIIDKLNIILPIVMAIAAGIAAWKIASFFGATLGTCAGIALTVAGAVAAIYGFCDALINGLSWENMLTMIIGIGVAVGGLAILFGTTGVAIGLIVGGLMLVIAGFKDWLENGKSVKALTAITVGLLAIGGALAIIFGWPALIVAAVAALVVAVVMYWDEICAALKIAWDWICDLFSGIGIWIYDNVIKPVCDFFVGLWDSIKKIFANIGTWFKNVFTGAWNGIKTAWGAVKQWFANLWQGIKNVFASIGTWFKNVFTGAWNGIKTAFSAVGTFFKNIWNTIKNMFTKIGSTIGNAIGGAFKTVVNSIINFAEKTINGFIKAINAAIGLINKIPGVNIKTLNLLEIPRLAKGGIVNNPGRGVPVIAGEAGAEAVLPLENNTEWMDRLAEKINGGAGKIIVPIYLNGRKIAEEIIDLTNRRNFATNGAI